MSRHAGLPYAPGLDGVRALAVSAVVAYHIGTTSGTTVLPGGFLGVDLFFVLSGYLITGLLVAEVRRTGRISIKDFYLRRARRLLPALITLLLVVGALGVLWVPEQAARLRGDLVAALGYVTNWWLIAENSSYFAPAGDRPALLTHLWSLAVEEQYYLVWPLVLIALAAVRPRRSAMIILVLAGVAASTVAAILLYEPFSDPSRVYYGTDTRALAPLLGGALALVVQPWWQRERPRSRRRWLDGAGIIALLVLAGVAAVLHDTDAALYRGGFLVIAALGAAVVAAAGHPSTVLGEALAARPLRWVGERSYAIYLWHWPVCVLTRPGLDIPVDGWANAALRIGVILVLADLSYRLIERPIRRHGLLAPLRTRAGAARPRLAVVRVAVLVGAMVLGGTAVGIRLSTVAERPVAGGPVDVGPPETLGPIVAPAAVLVSPPPASSVAASPPARRRTGRPTVVFFGDSQGMSLMLNRPADLGRYITAVDATIGGCGIMLGKVVSRSGERRNLDTACPNWRDHWADHAARHRPDIAVVVVGAWDVFDLIVDGATLRFGSARWAAHFTRTLRTGIDIVRATGAEVALALLPCYRPIAKSAGYWPERGDDERTRHVNELLRALAAAYPTGVHTVEPPGQFCTSRAIATNTAYRWDGIHYYRKGAALYFSAVIPQLLAL
jgi:peptidoglycan/LPS O-acetylase OafA/YrhL